MGERGLIFIPTGKPDKALLPLKEIHDIKIYGFLLTKDDKHPVSEMISKRFSHLHNLSGPNFLLLGFNPPSELSGHFKAYWEERFGEKKFKQIWDAWQKGVMPAESVNYCDLFKPKIKISQLPCLVLFTDLDNLEEQEVVVRSLPDWDTDSLYDFLSLIIELVRDCCEQPKEKRVKCLRDELTSPKAQMLANYRHIREKTLDFIKENPSYILLAPVCFLLAFANVQMISLSAGAILFLKYIKEVKHK